MRSRLVIVGVFGGDEQREVAECVGREIARAGQILLTGGTPKPGSPRTTEAAQNGAFSVATNDFVVRAIGIRPGGDAQMGPERQNGFHILIVRSGISHKQRDATNGATADVVIALKGSSGTLTEIAFAHALGRPIVLLDSRAHLQNKLLEHGSTPPGDGALSEFLEQALLVYPLLTLRMGKEDLEHGLTACLHDSQQFDAPACVEAVHRAIELARERDLGSYTGFPGIPPDPVSQKKQFERVLGTL